MHFDHSRSFKFINFTYDFLLVIRCDLSSISSHFRDILPKRKLKTTTPNEPPINFIVKIIMIEVETFRYFFSENCVNLPSAVLSQYTCVTERRQTDDRQHSMTITNNWTLQSNCSVWLKLSWMQSTVLFNITKAVKRNIRRSWETKCTVKWPLHCSTSTNWPPSPRSALNRFTNSRSQNVFLTYVYNTIL